MTALRPFFELLIRASVFWIGAFTVAWLALVVSGMSKPEARALAYFDAPLVAALAFPAAAGWLFGLAVQEFQHTSFAAHLPGVRRRLAAGFLVTGLGVSAITTLIVVGNATATAGPWTLLLMGLGAYCACGVLLDPLSGWVTAVNVVLVLAVVARSRTLARLAAEHPGFATAIAATLGAAGLWRLFARRTFRLKPFRLTNPLPGRFSLERTTDYERRRTAAERAGRGGWRGGSLGVDLRGWLRAANYEVHGGIGPKTIARSFGKMWGLLLIVAISAWVDRGEMSFVRAFGYSLYDALFRSPHVAPFGGEGGPYPMVLIVVAAIGAVSAIFKPVALSENLFYPLSRSQHARVAFLGGLADAALLFAVFGIGLYLLGQAIGLALGFSPRFDFMPYHLRVLLVTLALLPLAHWGRMRWLAARRAKAQNTIVALAFGVIGFVLLVALGSALSPRALTAPGLEIAGLLAMFVLTHWIYRGRLADHYRKADLA